MVERAAPGTGATAVEKAGRQQWHPTRFRSENIARFLPAAEAVSYIFTLRAIELAAASRLRSATGFVEII